MTDTEVDPVSVASAMAAESFPTVTFFSSIAAVEKLAKTDCTLTRGGYDGGGGGGDGGSEGGGESGGEGGRHSGHPMQSGRVHLFAQPSSPVHQTLVHS